MWNQYQKFKNAHYWSSLMKQLSLLITKHILGLMMYAHVNCTNPNLKSTQTPQLGEPAPKLELDL